MLYTILVVLVLILGFIIQDLYSRIRFLQKKSLQHDIATNALYDIIAFWMDYDPEKIDGSFESAKKKYIPGYASKSRHGIEDVRRKKVDEEFEKIKRGLDLKFEEERVAQEKYNSVHSKA